MPSFMWSMYAGTVSDPRFLTLAGGIIGSKMTEIAEIKLVLADIEKDGKRGSFARPTAYPR